MSQWASPPLQQQNTTFSGQPRRAGKHSAKAVFVVGILAFTAACNTGDGDASPMESTTNSTSAPGAPSTPTPAVTTPPAEEAIPGKTIGTPDNPYAPGDSFTVLDDWTFTVGATDTDTWPDISANFPRDIEQYQPDPGMVFVSAPATMTYTGPTTAQERVDGFGVYFIPLDGEPHKVGTCGRYGTSVSQFNGLAVQELPLEEGLFCTEVPQHLATGGQWRVSMYTIDEDNRSHLIDVFYAIN